MRRGALALALATAAAVTGCTVGPKYHAPAVLTGAAPPPDLVSGRESIFDPSAPLPPRWWRLYDDPVLDALVEKALVHNTDLRTALASLQQARAMLREIRAERLPTTTLTADPTYSQASADMLGLPKVPDPAPLYDIKESASYDVDLFGRLRSSVQEARLNAEAAQASLDLARVNVAASTAQAYSAACTAGLETAVTLRSLKVAEDTLYVTKRRYQAGINGSDDVVRADQLVHQTKSMLPSLAAQQRSALFMLATLTGDPPEAIPAAAAACVSPPITRVAIPIGDGAKLLARRPDVRQSERKLAAAVADIRVSTAGLYPDITIQGSLGSTTPTFHHLTSDKAFNWTVGGILTWSVPNLSVARAQIAASKSSAKESLAQFDGTVLTALRETETALTELARQLDTVRELTRSRDAAAQARDDQVRLYRGGVGNFYELLDAERTLIEAESQLASGQAQVSQYQIMLFMALGGGWQDAPPVIDVKLDDVARPRR